MVRVRLPLYAGFLLLATLEIPVYGNDSDARIFTPPIGHSEKTRTFLDYKAHIVAYKDLAESKCYLERMQEGITRHAVRRSTRIAGRSFYISNIPLTKVQIWRLAGSRISEFCRGYPTYLLQDSKPVYIQVEEDSNELTNTEKNAIAKENPLRVRRQTTAYFRGRLYKGQTQSQYLNFGNGQQPGKAEAESTPDGSRAVVSGNSGMGQAQSQSGASGSCDDCYGAGRDDGQTQALGYRPGKYQPSAQVRPGRPGAPAIGRRPDEDAYAPGGYRPGQLAPGQLAPGEYQPQPSRPGTAGQRPEGPGGVPGMRPGGYRPGQLATGEYQPSAQGIPGRPRAPERRPPEGPEDVYAPVGYRPGQLAPGQLAPGQLMPGQLAPGQLPPGQLAPGQLTSGQLAPGQLAPGQLAPGQLAPGHLMPGELPSGYRPGQLPPGHIPPGYRPGQLIPGQLAPGQEEPGQIPPGYRPGQLAPEQLPTGSLSTDQSPSGHMMPGLLPGQLPPGRYQPGQNGAYQPGQVTPGGYSPGHDPQTGYPTQPPSIPSGQIPPSQIYRPTSGQSPGAPGIDGWDQYGGQRQPVGPDGRAPIISPGYEVGTPGRVPGRITAETLITVNGYDQYGRAHIPGAQIPGQIPHQYPGQQGPSAQYPGAEVPGQYLDRAPGAQIPGRYPDQQTSGQYPGQQIPGQYPGGAQISGQYPASQIHDGYPGGEIPGQYPGTQIPGGYTSGVQIPDRYPVAQVPGSQIPGAQIPGAQIPSGYPGSQVPQISGRYPGAQVPGRQVPGGYPGSQVPGRYPGDQIPGGQVSGRYPGTQVPGGQVPGGYPGAQIPGGYTGAQVPSSQISGGHPGGQVPDVQIPGRYPGAQIPGSQISGGYPGTQVPSGYPGAQIIGGYPGSQVPGTQVSGGYPGAQIPSGYPGSQVPSGYLGAQIPGRYPGSQVPGGYPGAQVPGAQVTDGYPGSQVPGTQISGGYPGAQIPGGYSGAEDRPGQYAVGADGRPGCVSGQCPDGDDADSQAQSQVQQVDSETQASASAQGHYQGGTAQSQVSGTYSGGGSFSAQAGTIDGKRGAQTQVSGGKEGATSSAQGNAGYGQSQSQVQLLSDTGATQSGAQSSGWNHGTNTQVQAGEKGGMADAQANGPGSTSSQAQIGFSPYDEKEQDDQDQDTPFKGGGSANAQSGTYTGQSQSQIQGKFKFGIKYTGAAQAGSGTKESVDNSRNQTKSDMVIQPIVPLKLTQQNKSDIMIGSETQKVNRNHQPQANHFVSNSNPKGDSKVNMMMKPVIPLQTAVHEVQQPKSPDTDNFDDYEEEAPEYDDDDDYDVDATSEKPDQDDSIRMGHTISQSTKSQKQHILLGPLEDLDAHIIQAQGDPDLPEGMVLQPGQTIPGTPGYQIPVGYRGRVTSVAYGDKTVAYGKDSQAQSVTITPGTGKIHYITPKAGFTQSRNGGYIPYTYYRNQYPSVRSGGSTYPKFLTVTKSESGSQNLLTGKKTPQVYYTQSSTCGFFTNTCVYSGAKKICIPKAKSNPDGSPMTC